LAKALGKRVKPSALPVAEDTPYEITPFWDVGGTGRAWLDFQNDVTVKDIKQAVQESFRSVEHMKRYTTQGMATDQGKNSNTAALAVLADATWSRHTGNGHDHLPSALCASRPGRPWRRWTWQRLCARAAFDLSPDQ
jgi:sarcosine oxidase subunit alpha